MLLAVPSLRIPSLIYAAADICHVLFTASLIEYMIADHQTFTAVVAAEVRQIAHIGHP